MKKLNKIILVDDDEINNFINSTLINQLNITEELLIFSNGIDLLNYLKQSINIRGSILPSIIILDHHMPIMNGLDFMETFNEMAFPNKEDIKFLVLAAHSYPADIRRFKELGVHEFTPKPLNGETISYFLNKYFNVEVKKRYLSPNPSNEK